MKFEATKIIESATCYFRVSEYSLFKQVKRKQKWCCLLWAVDRSHKISQIMQQTFFIPSKDLDPIFTQYTTYFRDKT